MAQGQTGCGVMVLVAYHRGWTREPSGSTMRQHVVSYPPTDIHSLIVRKHSPGSPPPFSSLRVFASAGTLLHRPTLANGVITSTNPDVGVQDNLYAGIAMPHLSIS